MKIYNIEVTFFDELEEILIMADIGMDTTMDIIERLKDKGAHIVTLGKRILRTETAGFVATSLIQYELSDLGGND